jgi:asparagine synthase (glutamine-hydrolysing)
MGGFCGYLAISDSSIPQREALREMDKAMAHWGTVLGSWQEGPIALEARWSHASSVRGDSLPLIASDLILAGNIRLDGRAALLAALGMDRRTAADVSDHRLVAESWRKWGPSCSEHLYGDWVCAVWDRRRRTLWIGRDAAGNSGLYYYSDGYRMIFATDLNAILAHPAVARIPNPALIIDLQLPPHMTPDRGTATPYQDVFRLPGGHELRCDGRGLRLHNWWQPESLGETPWGDGDCHEAFRELYNECVGDRLHHNDGHTGVMLSAGLDSGSVAALAAPQLVSHGQRLKAYTAIPKFSPDGASVNRCGDEGALARITAEHIGNIDHFSVQSEDTSIIESIRRMIAIHGRPIHAIGNYFWIHDILRKAHEHNVKVMLTGQGGNATVSWSGTGNLWPDVRNGRLHTLSLALLGSNPWTVLKRQIIRPVITSWRDFFRYGNDVQRILESHSAVRPQLLREIDLPKQGDRSTGRSHPRDSSSEAFLISRFRLGRLAASMGSNWMEIGAVHGLDIRDPTLDRRLIEFCWRVPDRIFWARGAQRGLIRRGMSDHLPEAVLFSARKGLQAADIGHRILGERNYFQSSMDALSRHPLARTWLDLPKMRCVLNELGQGVTPRSTERAVSILLRGLSVGFLLETF